jgi:dCMP deaminase
LVGSVEGVGKTQRLITSFVEGAIHARERSTCRMDDRRATRLVTRLLGLSSCLSRQVGCIIVSPISGNILGVGANSVPRGINSCKVCRRSGKKSGEATELCPSVHGEINAILDALRVGNQVGGSTLYTSSIIPCKTCLGIIINLNIREIVVNKLEFYDELSQEFVGTIGQHVLNIREFDI